MNYNNLVYYVSTLFHFFHLKTYCILSYLCHKIIVRNLCCTRPGSGGITRPPAAGSVIHRVMSELVMSQLIGQL